MSFINKKHFQSVSQFMGCVGTVSRLWECRNYAEFDIVKFCSILILTALNTPMVKLYQRDRVPISKMCPDLHPPPRVRKYDPLMFILSCILQIIILPVTSLCFQIFKCPSVCWLSLKYNYLDRLPADIGRMAKLDTLSLTNNKLQNKSIPFTLTFCSNLHTLLLDNNLLDALPGFLLNMPALKTVHRHGNHNYFKSTFMWYHTDVNERILAISGTNDFMPRDPESLQFWAARTIIGLKLNFYAEPSIAPVLKDYISENYTLFNVCGHCNTAKLSSQPGMFIF